MSGLAALPLFLSLRAAIRAKVEAAGAERLEGAKRDEARALARGYFARAVEFLRYRPAPARRSRRALRRRQKRARRRARAAARQGARRAMAAQRPRAQGDVRRRGDGPFAGLGLCPGRHARRLSAGHREGQGCASGGTGSRARRDLRDSGGTQRRRRRGSRGGRRLRRTFPRRPARDAPRAHRLAARRRFRRRR